MAFDFGAALSSAGSIYPAAVEGQEIRRQRLADAAAVQQRAVASQDEHAARVAQTEREKQLTAEDARTANRYIPISSKPERGEDGKYYMLFLAPDNKIQRLPVDGNYDPNAEKLQTLTQLGIDPKSDLGREYLLNIKPNTSQPILKQAPDGTFSWIEKPNAGMPSAAAATQPPPSPSSPTTPAVIPAGFKGKMPLQSTTTHSFKWLQGPDNKWYKVPDTRTTTRNYGAGNQLPPSGRTGSAGVSEAPDNSPFPGIKPVGTGKLPASAEKVVITTQPVIDQTNRLIQDIDRLGLSTNNQSGYLAKDYAEYKLGKASPDGTLGSDIAALSLGSVVDAASALQGSSRSIKALQKAMEHTPNPWIDSPKLLREKLVNINSRLNDMVTEARSAGHGGGSKFSVGQSIQYRGRPATILAINPDGSYQLDVK